MTDYSTSGTPGSIVHGGGGDKTAAFNQISWGAVFAGVAVALTVQLLLNLLGVGVGAAVLDPGASDNPAAGAVSIAGGVWYVVAGLIGAFAGGYASSRLSGRPVKSTGAYHGLVTWAVTTLVVLYLLTTSVGALVGGAFSGLSSAVGGVGGAASSAVQAAAPQLADMNPLDAIEREIRDRGGDDPQAMKAGAVSAFQAVVNGDPAKADEARGRAAEALAKAQNIPVEQGRVQIGEYEAKYRQTVEQAKAKATDAAVTAAKVVSRGALIGFFALVLGAVAAWFGGSAGTVRAVPAGAATSATTRPRV